MSSASGSTGSEKKIPPLRFISCFTSARHFFSTGEGVDLEPARPLHTQNAWDLQVEESQADSQQIRHSRGFFVQRNENPFKDWHLDWRAVFVK